MYKHIQHLAIRKEITSGLISNKTAITPVGDVTIHETIVIHFVSLIADCVSDKVSRVSLVSVSLPVIVFIQDTTLL
jgi:hypothetical protein